MMELQTNMESQNLNMESQNPNMQSIGPWNLNVQPIDPRHGKEVNLKDMNTK